MLSSPMNAKLFINYRREDTRHASWSPLRPVNRALWRGSGFHGHRSNRAGEDFVEVINRKVSTCDIAIVAIGPNWLGATDASGKRRLDDEEDFVRMEIVAALERNIRVIPVLVDGARMPRKQDLPEPLAPLSRRNAIELSETRFHADVNRLIEAIEKSFAAAEKKEELSATPTAPPPESAAVRQSESKDLSELSESTRSAGPMELKEIHGDATPVRSTHMTPAPFPVPTSSPIAALKEPKVSTIDRRIVISAIVLLLLGVGWFLMWPSHQKAAKQGEQPASADFTGLPKPAEPKLTEQGDASTQFSQGLKYENGDGVPKDFGKAVELYRKAADQGHADAQVNLGWLYENGEGVPMDLRKAAELYQKAADQGNARAQK